MLKEKSKTKRGLFSSCFKPQNGSENHLPNSNIKPITTNSKMENNEIAQQNTEIENQILNEQILPNEIQINVSDSNYNNNQYLSNQFDPNYMQNNMVMQNNPAIYNLNQVWLMFYFLKD